MNELETWFSLASEKTPRMMFSVFTSIIFLLITFAALAAIGFLIFGLLWKLNIYDVSKENYPISGFLTLTISLVFLGSIAWYVTCGLILNSVYKTRDEKSNFSICFQACWEAKGSLFLVMLLTIFIIIATYVLKYITFEQTAYINYMVYGTFSQRVIWEFADQYAISLTSFYLLLSLSLFTVPLILTKKYKFSAAIFKGYILMNQHVLKILTAFLLMSIILLLANGLLFTFPIGIGFFWVKPAGLDIFNVYFPNIKILMLLFLINIWAVPMYYALYGVVFNSVLQGDRAD